MIASKAAGTVLVLVCVFVYICLCVVDKLIVGEDDNGNDDINYIIIMIIMTNGNE